MENDSPVQGERKLGTRAARGVLVTLIGQSVRILIQVVGVVVLARLLTPHDYGLLAMVVAIIGVAEIFRDFGLSYAAIQAPTLSRGQRDNLFWINGVIGLCLAGIVILVAPLLAMLYGAPELKSIAMVLSLTFVANGFATQYRADLTRRLKFTRLAGADVGSASVGLVVAVAMASLSAGYWALVAQQVTQAAVMLASVAVLAGWLPGRPRRGEPMRQLLRFGWDYVRAQLIQYVGSNADSVIIGAKFGAGPLGLYNRAFQLLMAPLGQLRSPTTTVALPILSRLHSNPERYDRFVLRGQVALGYGMVVGLGVVAGAATPITELFLGSAWLGVAPILRFIAIAGALQTFSFVCFWVYLSKEITGELVKLAYYETGIRLVCLGVGSLWGVVGVAAGYAVSAAIKWPIALWLMARKTDCPASALLRDGLRICAVATVLGMVSYIAVTVVAVSAAFSVAVSLACSGVALGVLALVVPPVRTDLKQLVAIVRAVAVSRSEDQEPAKGMA